MVTYDMDARGDLPKYEYLYRCIREDVLRGALAGGERMPSKRVLAQHLAVSVGTVEQAYDLLVSEGYLESRPGSGFFVCESRDTGSYRSAAAAALLPGTGNQSTTTPSAQTAQARSAAQPVPPHTSASSAHGTIANAGTPAGSANVATRAARANASAPSASAASASAAASSVLTRLPQGAIDFRANRLSMSLFPVDTWSRLMRRTLSERDPELFETVPYNGMLKLRRAIAAYLYELRGIMTTPDRIFIGAGTEYLYGRLLQLFGPQSVVGIADLGSKKLVDLSRSMRTTWTYIPVDSSGLRVDALAQTAANIVHVSPANLFPTGAVMPSERREQLLDWVHASPRRYIIEDDYDSELRYGGTAHPPLVTRDDTDQVVYMNTFSKTLVPSLRISYMVLPPTLSDLYRAQLSFYSCTVSSFEQYTLAAFIEGGYFERHITRLRRYYGKQRRAIIDALSASPLMEIAEIHPVNVGTHLLLHVDTRKSDDAVRAAAEARGLNLNMLSDYSVEPNALTIHYIVVNFASIEPPHIGDVVNALTDIFRDEIEEKKSSRKR
ncbi:MAG: PLP-dependent aminotransferase family protein [Eggerthellaceae bacterium]|jgi:GntR family transcriptional regulator/MocR family aminotransferase